MPVRSPRLPTGARGFTLIELITVVAVIMIVATLAIPSVLRARIAANEASAIATLRVIGNGQASYSASAGHGAYAAALATLATACPGGAEAFLPPDLAADPILKSGYRMELRVATASDVGPADCNGTVTRTAFYSTGVPIVPGLSGSRGFASSAPGTIYFTSTGVAPAEAAMLPGGGGSVLQ
jgi:type IV pilus assembly protein PilA